MRARWLGLAMAFLAAPSALAESAWLESEHLTQSEIRTLCERVSDVRTLARMQMMSSGDARWLRLSREGLVIEAAVMGASPLDPGRCYLIARAGQAGDTVRRAFEVRDFAVSSERTSVFVVGHAYDPPPGEMLHGR